jgi:hypothetical protein
VVGVVFTSDHIEDMTYRAFVWTPSAGMAWVDQDIRTGGPTHVQINNSGDIVHANSLWLHDGTPRNNFPPRFSSRSINNHGQVVGAGHQSGVSTTTVKVWSADWGEIDLGSVFGVSAEPLGINDAGQIVGSADETTSSGRVSRAILWRPRGDLAIDFGPEYGTWIRAGTTYTALHALSPLAMIAGDLDGSGTDDLILDFGGNVGVWAWMNRHDWLWIHNASPGRMIAADLDGDLRDEIVGVFPGAGVWCWRQGSWAFLHQFEATTLAVAQLDGQQGEDLVANFTGYGVYVWQNDSAWIGIHTLEATTIVTADLDANGHDDLVMDFPWAGIWVRFNNSLWGGLDTPAAHASRIVAGDIDGNGYPDLVADFGPTRGVWTYRNGETWAQLHGLSVESLTVADLDGTGKDEILIDFGATHGLWQYANDSDWSLLHAVSPDSLADAALH